MKSSIQEFSLKFCSRASSIIHLPSKSSIDGNLVNFNRSPSIPVASWARRSRSHPSIRRALYHLLPLSVAAFRFQSAYNGSQLRPGNAPKTKMKQIKLLLTILGAAVVMTAATATSAQNPKTSTLTGQLVCSICWSEADRKTTPFGSAADIECAIDCAEKGIASAIAVKDGDDYQLYLVEQKELKERRAEWLNHFGQQVEVTGRLYTKDGKNYVAPEKISYLSKSQQPAVIGAEVGLGLKDLAGIDQSLSSYRGRIVVLNFWATWCEPCRKEMPDLAAIQNAYAPFGVQVIGASADQLADRVKVVQFIRETKVNFPVWLGATTADMQRFGVGPGLPATIIIGRDGKIAAVYQSVVQQADLKKELDRLLGGDAATAAKTAKAGAHDVSLVPS
jgi:thiol-disulfide isomerase/thioredoxin